MVEKNKKGHVADLVVCLLTVPKFGVLNPCIPLKMFVLELLRALNFGLMVDFCSRQIIYIYITLV
jgi:hypothetical protein